MKTWEHLFDGELTDMQFKGESWTEELCYLGKNKWLHRSRGTYSYYPGTEDYPNKMEVNDLLNWVEEMDTNDLLDWIIEGDQMDLESSRSAPYFDIEQTQVIGDRTIRFRELAEKYKLKDCVDRINVIEKERAEDLREPTEDEIIELEKWEEKKKEVLAPFQEIINRWISYIVGKRPTGQGKPAFYHWKAKEGMVSRFISNYVFENGIMPSGKHLFGTTKGYGYEIHEFEVDFDEVVLKAKD